MTNVTCAIILFDTKVLVAQRSEIMKLPLKWEFPGGKLERDESEEDCIIREIKEELNIEIQIIKRLKDSLFDYGAYKINLIPFIVKYMSGAIVLAEHKEFKLLNKTELVDLDWADADLPILEEFLKLEI